MKRKKAATGDPLTSVKSVKWRTEDLPNKNNRLFESKHFPMTYSPHTTKNTTQDLETASFLFINQNAVTRVSALDTGDPQNPSPPCHQFRTGCDLAAWLSLTPLGTSSRGKEKLVHITNKDDGYIRELLVLSMISHAVMAKRSPEKVGIWTARISAEKPFGWQPLPWPTRLGSSGQCSRKNKVGGGVHSKLDTCHRDARY